MLRRLTLVLAVSSLLIACDTGPQSPRGFSLPVGDAAKGRQVFALMQCAACHTLANETFETVEKDSTLSVALGGEVSRVKTYAELVTSVINPSHRISKYYKSDLVQINGKSKMRVYNDVMTVTQLIDLVAYLQPHYTLREYQPTTYSGFH